MARKKDNIQIQTDVTTQEEWEEEIERPGLSVVDVYPDWCGPCVAMQGMLKKVKFELGDDDLRYITARADTIESLVVFRGRCEPLFLFFGSGTPVYMMRGAQAPLLGRKIEEQLKIEKKVMAGERQRIAITLECDSPAEVELPAVPSVHQEELDATSTLNARRQRSELRMRRALAPYSVAVLASCVLDRREEIQSLLGEHSFTCGQEVSRTLTEQEVDALLDPPSPPAADAEDSAINDAEAGAEPPVDADGDAEDAADAAVKPSKSTEQESAAAGAETTTDVADEEKLAADSAKRQAAKEKLLDGECVLVAIFDTQFNETKPYRWLTLYLGAAPETSDEAALEPEVSQSATKGEDGEQTAAASQADNLVEDGEKEGGEVQPEGQLVTDQVDGESQPTIEARLEEMLAELSVGVWTPRTVLGQRAALMTYFSELHRAAAPPALPEQQLAFAIFAGDRQAAVQQQLTDAGFKILHSGVDTMMEEVAEQLVANLDGGQSQIPELVAAPVYAAAVVYTDSSQLPGIANMDPLYLSDGPALADQDTKLVFASWGVEIDTVLGPVGSGGAIGPPPATQVPSEAHTDAPAENAPAQETPAEEGATEETPAEEAPAQEAPAEEGATEETPTEEGATEETPAEEGATEETPTEEAPAQEAPAEEAPAVGSPEEKASAEEAPTEETSAEGAPTEEDPAEEAPVEETPAEGAPAEEAPAEEAQTEEVPTDEAQTEAPTEEAPAEEAPVEEAPTEEAPAEDAETEEVPSEEAPAEDAPAEEAPAEEAPAEEAQTEEASVEEKTPEGVTSETAPTEEAALEEDAPAEE